MNELQDVILHVYKLETEQQQNQQQSQQQQSTGIRALNFMSRLLPQVGMGAYHTSIEIFSDRYTFAANAGIIRTRNTREGVPQGATYQEDIPLGACSCNRGQLQQIIKRLSDKYFTSTSYHLVHRNCNHFTQTLATSLILYDELQNNEIKDSKLVVKKYPDWINRLANTGKIMIGHDDDIISCNVIIEAKYAIGIDIDAINNKKKESTTNSKRKSNEKKELTEQQKAMLAKIKGGSGNKK